MNSLFNEKIKKYFLRACMISGTLLFFIGIFCEYAIHAGQGPLLALFLVSWLLIGGDVVFRALRGIVKGRFFDEYFLMSLATFGAFTIGEYAEGAAVMLFYKIGEAIQEMAVDRSRRSISSLMDIRPDFANVRRNGEIITVNPVEIKPGEIIVVKPGEKIPLDGNVIEGSAALDTSALTGESMPRDVSAGDEVLSGSINLSGLLTICVTKEFGESTVSKILALVEDAGTRKAPVENFITKFARWYTPVVVFAAAALAFIPPLIISGAEFSFWLRRALVFLVVSCPCALVISIPLSFFGGIGGASRKGILVKGGNYLSALNDARTVVFDKTGTLTRGVFSVNGIFCVDGISREELLFYAAAAESNSNHPIAVSIRQAYGKEIGADRISACEETAGRGIRVIVDGKTVLAGNSRLLEEAGIQTLKHGTGVNTIQNPGTSGTLVQVVIDGKYAGYLSISDEAKPGSKKAIEDLRKAGIEKIIMFTGDSKAAAEKTGSELGIDEVFSEMLPHEKAEQLENLEQEKNPKEKIIFVGDGINDAPALARSDIGVAMGGIGSDAAIEAADIVIMTDEPSRLVSALAIAKKTRTIVWQNIILALGVKTIILILGALGFAEMWEAVFGDVGVALIAVFNAMRAASVGEG